MANFPQSDAKMQESVLIFIGQWSLLQVVFKLKKKCGELTEEELGKVSVQLLNCQSSVEERTIYPCNEQMVRKHMCGSRVKDR